MLVWMVLSTLVSVLLLGVVLNVVGRQLLEGRTGASNAALTFLSVDRGKFPYCSGWLWSRREWSWIYPWAFLCFFAEWIRYGGRRVIDHPGFRGRLQSVMMESSCLSRPGQGSDAVVRNGRLGNEWSGVHVRAEDIFTYVTKGDPDAEDRWNLAHSLPAKTMRNYALTGGFDEGVFEVNDPAWVKDRKLAEHLFGKYANASSVAEIQAAAPEDAVEASDDADDPSPVATPEGATEAIVEQGAGVVEGVSESEGES